MIPKNAELYIYTFIFLIPGIYTSGHTCFRVFFPNRQFFFPGRDEVMVASEAFTLLFLLHAPCHFFFFFFCVDVCVRVSWSIIFVRIPA